MTRLLALLLVPMLSLFVSSCGCKQPPSVPKMRKMPKFAELQPVTEAPAPAPATEPQVIREK